MAGTSKGRRTSYVAPGLRFETHRDHEDLLALYRAVGPTLRKFPRKTAAQIARWRLGRLRVLVDHAYRNVDFYRQKYHAAGYRPGALRSLRDFGSLPTVSKDDLIAAWSDDSVANRILSRHQATGFQTRTSGSSGKFLTLAQDRTAVLMDTLLGTRQIDRQSGGRVGAPDLLLHIYTIEWWFSSVAGLYRSDFIASTTPTDDIAAGIRALRPAAVALYPSTLRRLAQTGLRMGQHGVRLIIVHSEQSRRRERDDLARLNGVPVLEEYSSEELTRIALECPGRRLHAEEDAAYVEVLRAEDDADVPAGQIGEIVGTNLLNLASPVIRYRQGDRGAVGPSRGCSCGSNFRQLSHLEGRAMDSFATPDGRVVTSGALMDAAYHWRLSLGLPVHALQYRIVQEALDRVRVLIVPGPGFPSLGLTSIKTQLASLLGPGVTVHPELVGALPQQVGPKVRTIVSLLPGRK